jgi:hypothetical protein
MAALTRAPPCRMAEHLQSCRHTLLGPRRSHVPCITHTLLTHTHPSPRRAGQPAPSLCPSMPDGWASAVLQAYAPRASPSPPGRPSADLQAFAPGTRLARAPPCRLAEHLQICRHAILGPQWWGGRPIPALPSLTCPNRTTTHSSPSTAVTP